MHHICPYRVSKDNSQENLIPLCKSHHHLIEWEIWEAEDADVDLAAFCELMRTLFVERQTKVRRWFCDALRERDSIPCVRTDLARLL